MSTLAGYQQPHTLGGTAWRPDGASTPFRFPGQYEDPETGLHYNHHRYYDPVTGRYLSPDPLGLAPAPNPHAYVPNPTLLTDPLGLACVSPNGLKNASPGLKAIFSDGGVAGKSIISIRQDLLDDGFTQTLTQNKSGYLFENQLGEQVRIMRRNGGWDIRIRNQYGNYLDQSGNVAAPSQAHGIPVYSK